jgi:hypothetical protein
VPDEKDRKAIAKISSHLHIQSMWKDYVSDFTYEEKGQLFKKIGFMLFRVRVKKESTSIVRNEEIRPNHMQQIIFRFWFSLTKKYKAQFKFDDATPPYVFSVCSGYNPASPRILWTPDNLNKYKRELGMWAEIYSGQFDDYRDVLHASRIEHDVSNRLSEIHIINRNCSLIYLEPDNFAKFFIKDAETPNSTGYISDTLINSVVRVRTILFAILLVSSEVDNDTKNLANPQYGEKASSIIKTDLDKTTRLKNALQLMIAPFFTDLSRSNRQHYTSLILRAVEMYDIKENWGRISGKIETNLQQMNAIFLDKQSEVQDQQEKLLNLVNFILGAGIIFDLLGYLLVGSENESLFMQILSLIFLAILLGTLLKMNLPKLQKLKGKKDGD